MGGLDLVLGIDSSTQGTKGVLLDRRSFRAVAEARVRYRDDPRLAAFGLSGPATILPPSEAGEALQPAALYLAALDALLEDVPRGLLSRVAAIDLSAQQHGQVWLGAAGRAAVWALGAPGAGGEGRPGLAASVGPGLAWEAAPIWMSANAGAEAATLREALGGRVAMTARSGSDSPLRFSGPVLMHAAKRRPETWRATRSWHLISSFLCGALSANPDCPIDWGNGSGTSLMDWAGRRWDPELLAAAARDIGVAAAELSALIPPLAHPLTEAGKLAAYFEERFGMSPECRILVGSGDNPQSKVLAEGSLLSLGTSFVLMAEGDRPHPAANAMYDGLGWPFLFGCRTNGALAWERVRRDQCRQPDDFRSSEEALASTLPGPGIRLLQPERESFPDSPPLDEGASGHFKADYAGVVDSSLGLVWLASRPFARPGKAIAVTGGAAASPGVLARVASMWRARVIPLADAGAATGAALAAALSLLPESEREAAMSEARAAAAGAGKAVEPDPRLVEAYHGRGGYLGRLGARAAELGMELG
jgi:xylulokinase